MKSFSENKCKELFGKSGAEEDFVLELETRRLGIVKCELSSLFAWIFHSDERSK